MSRLQDTGWFHALLRVATAVCFPRGRVRFCDPSGALASPTQGQAFWYFGDDIGSFARHFRTIGSLVGPLDVPGGGEEEV